MISINLTIFNKGFLIDRVLTAIKNNTVLDYEIVIVLDGCIDNSEEKVLNFFKVNNIKHKIFYADNVFETKANNIAAKNSENDIIIIIQDDMIINEYGWDERLIKPIRQFSDVVSVSANCAHDYIYNPNNKSEFLNYNPNDYWCDLLRDVNHVKKGDIERNIFAIRTTSNRGPLAINHVDLEKLNYFDEAFYPQICDDHDLHYRAFEKLGKITGLYWIDFISDRRWGATRSGNASSWLFPATHKNYKLLWNRHKDQILNTRPAENRILK
jgi:glycosyltransferase involved in cell wall biosynthesis